ncbi:hypothetical protein [Pseudomonas yamanorum]|uniref:hypothetical protein n=1 Tax=Pseudomonas yamanorum TaxID=515393 RepID=UPI0034E50C58
MPEFPDNLPEKWQNKGLKTCRLGLTCYNVSDVKNHEHSNQRNFLRNYSERKRTSYIPGCRKKCP